MYWLPSNRALYCYSQPHKRRSPFPRLRFVRGKIFLAASATEITVEPLRSFIIFASFAR